jgi:hypothetical protein
VVEFEGVKYETGKGGKYRCPWPCSDPNYPPRSFKTEKGFLKHLGECKAKPRPELVYVPEEPGKPKAEGLCLDCGQMLYRHQSCWRIGERVVCYGCREAYMEAGMGFHDCLNLELPGLTLEL